MSIIRSDKMRLTDEQIKHIIYVIELDERIENCPECQEILMILRKEVFPDD